MQSQELHFSPVLKWLCLRYGPSCELSLTLGTLPKQSQSSPFPLLEIKDLPAALASFATKCRSHFSCSIQADLWVEVLQKEKRRTEASFCNTENSRTLPRPKYLVTLEDILEEISCCPLQRQGPLLVVAVLLSSLDDSVNSRVTEYQLHFVVYGKYLASLPWMCAVVAEINISVHKLLLRSFYGS